MSGPAGHLHCLRVDIDPELTLPAPRDGSSPQAQRPGSMSQATQRMQWQDDSGGMPSKLTVRSASSQCLQRYRERASGVRGRCQPSPKITAFVPFCGMLRFLRFWTIWLILWTPPSRVDLSQIVHWSARTRVLTASCA